MFIKQIIEFQLKGAGPQPTCNPKTSSTCTPKTGYFENKTKISKKNKSSSELLLTSIQLYCRRQCTLVLLTWINLITKFILLAFYPLYPPSLATFRCLCANPGFWSSILRYFCLTYSSSFWKFLIASYCMWFADWVTPIKNPSYDYARIQKVFTFGHFIFKQKKMLSSSREQDIFEDM